jgi:Zn-finger nucleic acid-binding protein
MRTVLLTTLYKDFGIDNLSLEQHGKTSDRLGKLYEKYVLEIFKDLTTLQKYNSGAHFQEKNISNKLLNSLGISLLDICQVSSSDANLGRTAAGGSPKTDATISITLTNQTTMLVPLNIKHSSQNKVSIAEYDVDTICTGVGIPDGELKDLIKKHQDDQSAKFFSEDQKKRLTDLLAPHKENFIRWCVTLSAKKSKGNIAHPDLLVRFKVVDREYVDVKISNIEDYISERIADGSKSGNPGFGTGLGWTYASGSKSKKMQFKG